MISILIQGYDHFKLQQLSIGDTVWKVSAFGAFPVCIFPHSDWIRRDTNIHETVIFLKFVQSKLKFLISLLWSSNIVEQHAIFNLLISEAVRSTSVEWIDKTRTIMSRFCIIWKQRTSTSLSATMRLLAALFTLCAILYKLYSSSWWTTGEPFLSFSMQRQ